MSLLEFVPLSYFEYFFVFFFFSSRRRHTRFKCDWSSDVCSSDLCERISVRLSSKLTARGRDVGGADAIPRPVPDQLRRLPDTDSLAIDGQGQRDQIGRASCRERV